MLCASLSWQAEYATRIAIKAREASLAAKNAPGPPAVLLGRSSSPSSTAVGENPNPLIVPPPRHSVLDGEGAPAPPPSCGNDPTSTSNNRLKEATGMAESGGGANARRRLQEIQVDDIDDDDNDFIESPATPATEGARLRQSSGRWTKRARMDHVPEAVSNRRIFAPVAVSLSDPDPPALSFSAMFNDTDMVHDESVPPDSGAGYMTGMPPPSTPDTNRVPTIFYGTRTHKQISQMVRELRRSGQTNVTMCVLASRDKTCIHSKVAASSQKNELCKSAIETHDCRYYHNVKTLTRHSDFRANQRLAVWDIEDLVELGKKTRSCPYFAAREMVGEANIVFCPYNYLVDPVIRKQMGLNIKDSIIILDEAHNIEDVARESMSLTVSLEELVDAENETGSLRLMCSPGCRESFGDVVAMDTDDGGPAQQRLATLERSYSQLNDFLSRLNAWLLLQTNSLTEAVAFEKAQSRWSGMQAVAVLEQAGVTGASIKQLSAAINSTNASARASEQTTNEAGQKVQMPTPSPQTAALLERLLLIIEALLEDGSRAANDYAMVISKSATTTTTTHTDARPAASVRGSRRDMQRRLLQQERQAAGLNIEYEAAEADQPPTSHIPGNRDGRPSRSSKAWSFSLNFWCLNPGVGFRSLSKARSVILTSGTLSPMTSFASELQTEFAVRMEGKHQVDPSQLWVGAVGVGPSGTELSGVYKSAETFSYQDEVGQLVLRVCRTVPHGVLCFFPSYSLLEKMTLRWRDTGVWQQLAAQKTMFVEPKSADKAAFEEMMQRYQSVIERGKSQSPAGAHGNKSGSSASSGASASTKPPRSAFTSFFTLQQKAVAGSRTSKLGTQKKGAANADTSSPTTGNGALLLGVCRGKISEGIDFADDQARAVIIVSIPFPNYTDPQVELKRLHNDQRVKQGLLAGKDWYEIQAFRAVNQAVGRCIRHKADWGAIIFADQRFSANDRLHGSLSSWVRHNLKTYKQFDPMMQSLASFMDYRAQLALVSGKDAAEAPSSAVAPSAFVAKSEVVGSVDSQAAVPTIQLSVPIVAPLVHPNDALPRRTTQAIVVGSHPAATPVGISPIHTRHVPPPKSTFASTSAESNAARLSPTARSTSPAAVPPAATTNPEALPVEDEDFDLQDDFDFDLNLSQLGSASAETSGVADTPVCSHSPDALVAAQSCCSGQILNAEGPSSGALQSEAVDEGAAGSLDVSSERATPGPERAICLRCQKCGGIVDRTFLEPFPSALLDAGQAGSVEVPHLRKQLVRILSQSACCIELPPQWKQAMPALHLLAPECFQPDMEQSVWCLAMQSMSDALQPAQGTPASRVRLNSSFDARTGQCMALLECRHCVDGLGVSTIVGVWIMDLCGNAASSSDSTSNVKAWPGVAVLSNIPIRMQVLDA
ncbi:fanconi anemia J, variant 1 [Capsaspora owczarzaki ATCC 30864]|nr:fanconi anemia J, variant 1 [Capsaspora owczarzaki ATCC 30864]